MAAYGLHGYVREMLELYDGQELMRIIDEMALSGFKDDLKDDELLKKYLLSFISDY